MTLFCVVRIDDEITHVPENDKLILTTIAGEICCQELSVNIEGKTEVRVSRVGVGGAAKGGVGRVCGSWCVWWW